MRGTPHGRMRARRRHGGRHGCGAREAAPRQVSVCPGRGGTVAQRKEHAPRCAPHGACRSLRRCMRAGRGSMHAGSPGAGRAPAREWWCSSRPSLALRPGLRLSSASSLLGRGSPARMPPRRSAPPDNLGSGCSTAPCPHSSMAHHGLDMQNPSSLARPRERYSWDVRVKRT